MCAVGRTAHIADLLAVLPDTSWFQPVCEECFFVLIAFRSPIEPRPLADLDALLAVSFAVDYLDAFGPEAAA